jgi:hypothetical protein
MQNEYSTIYMPKDMGAIELMGGVSKTHRRDFVPEPDIKLF